MEKEQQQKPTSNNTSSETITDDDKIENQNDSKSNAGEEKKKKEVSPEEQVRELEDKLARAFAEMENQRRRFEKEKEDAFDYGGYSFAKEALSLIDNLERSKQVLENDEKLKSTEALKKTLEHLDIINKDLISIFSKNNINPIDCINKKLDPNFLQSGHSLLKRHNHHSKVSSISIGCHPEGHF